jgi:predicted amidohydrolase
MTSENPRQLRVAAGQLAACPMADAGQSLTRIDAMIARAAEAGAELLVLPECAYPAYAIGSPDEYRRGGHLRHLEFLAHLSNVARRHRIHVVCGFVEDAGDRLFNSAAVVDADGRLCGVARKSLLWMMDNKWFAPAEEIAPIDTPLGRIGVTICADNRVPEITATLAAKGAEIICVPTCWLDAASDGEACRNPQPEFMIPARSREFGVVHVCADKVGREGPKFGYVGMSLITDAEGNTIEMADSESEALIGATVPIGPARVHDVIDENRNVILSRIDYPTPDRPDAASVALLTTRCLGAALSRDGVDGVGRSLRARGVSHALVHDLQALPQATINKAFKEHGVEVHWLPSKKGDVIVSRFVVSQHGCASDSFAPSRAAALFRALVVAFRMRMAPIGTLRTRAIENHVYVAALGDDEAILIGPDAEVIAHVTDEPVPLIATLDLKRAANKEVAPMTDIFAQRRPHQYSF